MASEGRGTILVTGANGYLGFGILSKALQDGYWVRGVVRSDRAANMIKKTPTGRFHLDNGTLSIILIPSLSAPGLLLEAARGCKYIVHAGSPVPGSASGDLVSETLDGIKKIIGVAETTKSICRVVFTLSIYSLFQKGDLLTSRNPLKIDPLIRVLTDDSKEGFRSDSSANLRYNAAKIASKKLIEDYVASSVPESSHFSIVNMHPAFVLGPSEVVTSKVKAYSQSCGLLAYMWLDLSFLMSTYLGQPRDAQPQMLSCHCHVDDCSEAHVKALDGDKLEVKDKLRSFLICSDGPLGHPWESATAVVKRDMPDIAETINWVPCRLNSRFVQFDCSDTERDLLGRKLIPFSQQVRDTVPWMLSLPDK